MECLALERHHIRVWAGGGQGLRAHGARDDADAAGAALPSHGSPRDERADGVRAGGGNGGSKLQEVDWQRRLQSEQRSNPGPKGAAPDHPVLDTTGLTGAFDFTIEWAPEGSTAISEAPNAGDAPADWRRGRRRSRSWALGVAW